MEFDLENPLSQDLHHSLFAMESDHMTPSNSDYHLRRQVISFISHFSQKLRQPFVSYLATNYLHRFLAAHSIPEEKPWILKLVAVSCVSLAFKMMEAADSSPSDIQKNGGSMFDFQMVERMEFLILGALKWRMRSITPFAFVKFFVSMFELNDASLDDHHRVLKDRAKEIIFKAQIESKLLEFKPSIISASALLCASHELYPLQLPCFKKSISSCSYVNEDELSKCYSVIQEAVMDGYESVPSCKTPINVLDLDYSSSEDTHTKTTPSEDDEEEKRGFKRLKISTFSKSPFQPS